LTSKKALSKEVLYNPAFVGSVFSSK